MFNRAINSFLICNSLAFITVFALFGIVSLNPDNDFHISSAALMILSGWVLTSISSIFVEGFRGAGTPEEEKIQSESAFDILFHRGIFSFWLCLTLVSIFLVFICGIGTVNVGNDFNFNTALAIWILFWALTLLLAVLGSSRDLELLSKDL